MNKKIIVVVITVIALSIVGTIAINIIMSPKQNITSPTETGVSIQSEISGHYEQADKMYYITGNVQNTGDEDATNFKIVVTLLNAINDEEIKSETLTIGTISAKSSKDLNYSLTVPNGYTEVVGRWETTWDSQ